MHYADLLTALTGVKYYLFRIKTKVEFPKEITL